MGSQSHLTLASVSLTHHSHGAVIQAAYRQVFGREVLASQRQSVAEPQLKAGKITLREFIRQLAKTRLFRQMYWENLYITKAIEYIHRQLLGRPTYGRREMAQYYDICAHQGFYAFVDALMDSADYGEAFGEDTVPYERYVTPRGLALRSPQGPVGWSKSRDNPPIAGEWMRDRSAAKIVSRTAVMDQPRQTEPSAPVEVANTSDTQTLEVPQTLAVHGSRRDLPLEPTPPDEQPVPTTNTVQSAPSPDA